MRLSCRFIVALFVFCLCHDARGAQQDCENPCGPPAAWSDFNAFDFRVTVQGKAGYQTWRGRIDKESNDAEIDTSSSDGVKLITGKILLVGGRFLAIRGPIAEEGYEIDALDAPVLYLNLTAHLLGEALPNGPGETAGERKVELTNQKNGIRFATPSAEGYVAPPWSLSGTVIVSSLDNVQYELTLVTKADSPMPGAHFAGHLSKIAAAKIDDALPLAGWKVFSLGVQSKKRAEGTIFDYGAAPATSSYARVSDLRRKISEEDYPGEPDSSKNFTGFWKEDCDQAFGLQIMPFGKDGKYSVTFCGPGGCGVAGEEGKNTFISKDPHYIVVSEDELKIRNAENKWDTYHRCTTETHPVLKYKE